MAKQTTVEYVDDITGESGPEADVQTVQFNVTGKDMEIDLSAANREAFKNAVAPYVAAARRVDSNGRSRTRSSSAPKTDRDQNRAIRDWAEKAGYKISERGRIPSEVLDAFHEAH